MKTTIAVLLLCIFCSLNGQTAHVPNTSDSSYSHLEKSADLKIASKITAVLGAGLTLLNMKSVQTNSQITSLPFSTYLCGAIAVVFDVASLVEFKKAGKAESKRKK